MKRHAFPARGFFESAEVRFSKYRSAALIAAGVVTLLGYVCPHAAAFDPPEDTAGPLHVRIEGPSQVTQTDTPVPIKVLLENRGGSTLKGTVRISVIDQFRADPSAPLSFSIPAQATEKLDFCVTVGNGTHNALYPVHAFVECPTDGQPLSAHPILIVEALLPDPPSPERTIPWMPVTVPAEGAVALWRLPVSRVVLHLPGEAPVIMPVDRHGMDGRTRASASLGCESVLRGDARESIGVHPPWYGVIGAIVVEYPLRLPGAGPMQLRFGNAIRDHYPERGEPASDGVTFRVRVTDFETPPGELGEVIFETHTDAKIWQEGKADLSRYAGKTIRVQFEAHPGPRNDVACDLGYWGEPLLTIGTPHAETPPETRRAACTLGDIIHEQERYPVSVTLGARGLLDGEVRFGSDGAVLAFQGFRARVLNDPLADTLSLSTFVSYEEERVDEGMCVRHRFTQGTGSFDLVGHLWTEGPALRARFSVENGPPAQPWRVVYLEDLSVGPWSKAVSRVYAGCGNVIVRPEAFRLGFDGHQLSTSFVGFDFADGMSMVQASDVPPENLEVSPASRVYTLHTPHTQTLTFIPARNVWEGVKRWRNLNGLKAASGVEKLAGRFVFDLWGGRYGPSAQALERAFRYGLTDSVVVWHNWQRWGYDYRLPDIWPPNPDLGTTDEFVALATTCKNHGVLFAPHDNYIDFYPDAEDYSYERIAFHSDGRPIRAWLNAWRGAQAFRWRPDRVRPFVDRNVGLIRDACAPTAYFIDVWSSIGPHDYWTQDGRFFDRVFTRNTWGELFAWIRDALGDNAPQISESGHDQLIGWLDGAQANHLRVDPTPPTKEGWTVWQIRCADAERVPWFDAAHHDRFVLHGAGYESRYVGGMNARLHGIYSDDYITTEVLTGHPAMVPAAFDRHVVRKYWLLHDLMRSLALRRIEGVEFAEGDIHRQHVRWDNGGEVWVNRGSKDWRVAGHTLPEYGFYARVPTETGLVEAAIEQQDDVIVDWSRSPAMIYVNARAMAAEGFQAGVRAQSVRFAAPRTLDVRLSWNARQPLKESLTVFVHFVNEKGEIRFQGDHAPVVPTTEWRGTVQSATQVNIPEDIVAGDAFELRVGLYSPKDHTRALLEGMDDGNRAIRLGAIRMEGDKEAITGISWTPFEQELDPYLKRLNTEGKALTFADGAITSDGACRFSREGDRLLITPLPDSLAFTVRVRWDRLPWRLPTPKQVEALDEDGKVLETVALEEEDSRVLLYCQPGTFAYKL